MDPKTDAATEIHVRLLPGQMTRLAAMAAARVVPPAVVARELIVRELTALEAQLTMQLARGG
jgi:hypothetical protein